METVHGVDRIPGLGRASRRLRYLPQGVRPLDWVGRAVRKANGRAHRTGPGTGDVKRSSAQDGPPDSGRGSEGPGLEWVALSHRLDIQTEGVSDWVKQF